MIYSIGFVAFFCAWLFPGHYFPWMGFQQEVAAACGALLLALAAVVSTGQRRVSVPAASMAVLGLATVPMLQWATGEVPFLADALLSSLYLAAFGLTAIAALALAKAHCGRNFVTGLFLTILAAAVASTAIGLGQWLQLGWTAYVEQLGPSARMSGNFTQPNHLASLIGMGIVAAWWLFESRRVGVATLFVLLLLLGFGLVATQSRAGWGFVLMLVLWWALARHRAGLRATGTGVATASLAFMAATMAWARVNAALDLTTATQLGERLQSVGGRGVHWPALWDAAWRHPLTGWGWMQVGAAQQAVALDHPPSHEWVSFSHNLVLDLLVWNGVVLGGLVCVAIVWWIASRCWHCRDVNSWALLATGGVLLVHSLLEFPHAYSYFLLPLAVFVGIVEARTTAPLAASAQLPMWAFAIMCTATAALLAQICVDYLAVQEAASRTLFKEAGYVAPGGQQPRVPDVVLLDNQREFIWFRLTPARAGMTPLEIDRMRRINQRFMPPAVMLRFALAAGLNGRPDEARRNLRLICQMWPAQQCDEGRQSWAAAIEKFPALQGIAFPAPATR